MPWNTNGTYTLPQRFGTGTPPSNDFPPQVGQDFDDIAASLAVSASSSGVALVSRFGSDPTGSNDNTTAFTNAAAAVPANGGIVLIPPGNYKFTSPLQIGNGSSSSASTQKGVKFVGIGMPWVGNFPNNGTSAPVRLFYAGSTTSHFVQVLGPMIGWGAENLQLDGGGLVSNVLEVKSAAYGDCRNLYISGGTSAGLASITWDPFSGGLSNADSLHNSYQNIAISLTTSSGCKGILIAGGSTATVTSNTDFNMFQNITIFGESTASTVYGIYNEVSDGNAFMDVHIIPGAASAMVGVAFDYSRNNLYPTGNMYFMIDNACPIQYQAIGSPLSTTNNYIFGISHANGGLVPFGVAGITAYDNFGYNIKTLTVSGLPSPSAAAAGFRAMVSDANATTFASVVAGGGTNGVPVYCDGTNWRIG